MKILLLIASAAMICSFGGRAQVAINTDGSSPVASAMLDVKSTTKGILVPRMTSAERGLIASPATGLLVYQTNAPAGYYYFNGTAWKQEIDAVAGTSNPPANNLLTFDGTNWVAKNLVLGLAGSGQGFSNLQPYLCMNYCIALFGYYPSPSGIDPFIGEVELFAFSFAPNGWAQCNGQLMPIAQYSALFSLLGTTYGGNGLTTFSLPDLRGRMPVGQGQGPGLTPRTIGEMSGSESIYLTIPNLPSHTHTISFQ
ncbi:MAG: tail fiber protein [Bacteroidales bacterium]|nr:tail fiber protein [Bacteroidales bacterium]